MPAIAVGVAAGFWARGKTEARAGQPGEGEELAAREEFRSHDNKSPFQMLSERKGLSCEVRRGP
jgi:hypothetical protein